MDKDIKSLGLAFAIMMILTRVIAYGGDLPFLIKALFVQWIIIYIISYHYLTTTKEATLKSYLSLEPITLHLLNIWILITAAVWLSINTVLTIEMTLPYDVFTVVVVFLVSAPICEEIFFRQILLKELERAYDYRIAIVVSSLAFAVIHNNVLSIISALIMGLVIGYAFYRTKNIGVAIVMHSVYNLMNVIYYF